MWETTASIAAAMWPLERFGACILSDDLFKEAPVEPEEIVDDLWQDIEASRSLNGIYANRIYVQPLGEGMVRINIGEVLNEYDIRYHTAIVVTAQQAKAFAQVIFNIASAVMQRDYAPPPPFSPPSTGPDNGGE